MAAAARPSSRAAQAGAADHRQPEGKAVRRLMEMRQFRGAFCPHPRFVTLFVLRRLLLKLGAACFATRRGRTGRNVRPLPMLPHSCPGLTLLGAWQPTGKLAERVLR